MGLDIALMHRPGREVPLDDDIGLGEAGLDVALGVLDGARDVRGLAVERHPVVEDGRVVGQRVVDLDGVRQDLVIHLDQLAGLRRDGLGHGRDGGDRVTMEQRLVPRHHIAAHPAHVLNAERHRCVDREIDDVGGGHHRLHAGQGLGPGRVDGLDDGMGVGAAQHLAPDHAGHARVGREGRAPGDLVGPVGTDRAFTDPLVLGIAHQAAPRISAAVSSTARIILS